MNVTEGAELSARSNNTERGATATEYAVLLGFFALAIIAGVTIFGAWLNGYYADTGAQLRAMLH